MMASLARAARFMVLLQIALFVVLAVIISSSVCHGAGIDRGALNPSRGATCGGRPCGQRGGTYTGRPQPYPYRPQPGPGAPPPYNGGIGRP